MALSAYASGRFEGISFALGDGIFGIDLDACIDEFGEIAPWAEEIVESFRTYAEISPSGSGIKIYGIGEYNETGISKKQGQPRPNGKTPAIEINGWGKFFAVTGRIWPDSPAEIRPCRVPLAKLLASLGPRGPQASPVRQVERKTPMTERASRWLEKVEGTVSGNGGCHNKTFRAACRLIGRFGMSIDETFALMTQWNMKCDPPWSDRELQHKVKQAWMKYGRV